MKNPQPITSDEKQRPRTPRPAWQYFLLGGGIALVGAICLASLGLLIFPQVRAPLLEALKPGPPAPPTPPCVSARLSVGPSTFTIESLKRQPDGSLSVPPDQAGTAYWVEGSAPGYVFALSPAADNMLLLASVQEGAPVHIAWGDCSEEDFSVQAKEIGQPELDEILRASGVTIFASDRATDSAIVLRGGMAPVATAQGSPPEAEGVQAEISFLDTAIAPDGSTLTMGIEITNTGSEPIDLTGADIDLTVEGGAPQAPLRVEPALPLQIQPGASLGLQITFAKPGGNVAVFRLLDFSVDQYY